MATYGVKDNKCFEKGLQGVIKQIIAGAPEGSSLIYGLNGPKNNHRYVVKNYSKVTFGEIPTNPDPDYNFQITCQNDNGFIGAFAGNFLFSYNALDETYAPIGLKLDNPDFDITDGYTVIHLHIWHDGIKYCCHIDGYSES